MVIISECDILERGEYSVFVDKEIKNYVLVSTKDVATFMDPKEIVASPNGTIIYFNEKISDLLVGEDVKLYCFEDIPVEEAVADRMLKSFIK